jgi:hypothetical protein
VGVIVGPGWSIGPGFILGGSSGLVSVAYIVIAGGGGGAGWQGGGGGAGGYLTGTTASIVPATPYTVTVGTGGNYGNYTASGDNRGTNGNNSVFASITSTGGGAGGSYGGGTASFATGNSGGSGGGGGFATPGGPGGAASPAGQGNIGGNGVSTAFNMAGGGGAGLPGGFPTGQVNGYGGVGGDGVLISSDYITLFAGTGSTISGNTRLTVTATTAGQIGIGTQVTGNGIPTAKSFAITALSNAANVVTATFATQAAAPFAAGMTIQVAGVTTITGYNGSWRVISANVGNVSFACSNTGVAGLASATVSSPATYIVSGNSTSGWTMSAPATATANGVSLTSSGQYFAGGGGGGGDGGTTFSGQGGAGGGAAGAKTAQASNAAPNTGGGGGGAYGASGGSGGSGIIFLSIPNNTYAFFSSNVTAILNNTITANNVYKITSTSTLSETVIFGPMTAPPSVDYLMIAGGGGGGIFGGGGGAGGYLTGTSFAVTAGAPITITVGTGGAGSIYATATSGTPAVAGGNSVIAGSSTVTAQGGGTGGNGRFAPGNATSGGSGGGGATRASGVVYISGTGTAGQGNDGGYGGVDSNNGQIDYPSGGGGGAGAVGEYGLQNQKLGFGGAGLLNSFVTPFAGTGNITTGALGLVVTETTAGVCTAGTQVIGTGIRTAQSISITSITAAANVGTVNYATQASAPFAAGMRITIAGVTGSVTTQATSSISGSNLTLGGVNASVAIGQLVTGTGVTAGTYITSGSGTAWTVNKPQTVASTTLTFSASWNGDYQVASSSTTATTFSANITGTATVTGATISSLPTYIAFGPSVFQATFAGTVMTVVSTTSGIIAIGQVISGPGITAGTTIVSPASATTWNISSTHTIASSTTITGSHVMSAPATATTTGIALTSSGQYYAGGGGGEVFNTANPKAAGGAGGGGVGCYNINFSGTAGAVNTGGGGGGGGSAATTPTMTGGSGGTGVVILRYLVTYAAPTSTTGSPTVTTDGTYRYYKFTGSGTITF